MSNTKKVVSTKIITVLFSLILNLNNFVFKVNELRYEQCWVTPHFSAGENLLKKLLRKDKNIDTIIWEKLFDRFADHNNTIYRDSLTLIAQTTYTK